MQELTKIIISRVIKGPWKTITEGIWGDVPIDIIENQSHQTIILGYDIVEGKVKGALVLTRDYLATDEKEDVYNIPEELGDYTLVIKKAKERNTAFVAFGPNSAYVTSESTVMVETINNQINEIESIYGQVVSSKKLANTNLTRLSDASKEYAQALFGDPLYIYYLNQQYLNSMTRLSRINLGFTTGGTPYSLIKSSLFLTKVIGKQNNIRDFVKNLTYNLVQAENNVVVLKSRAFQIGFSEAKNIVTKKLGIDYGLLFSKITLQNFIEKFLKSPRLSAKLATLVKDNYVVSFEELIQGIKSIDDEDLPQYESLKFVRLLKLIEKNGEKNQLFMNKKITDYLFELRLMNNRILVLDSEENQGLSTMITSSLLTETGMVKEIKHNTFLIVICDTPYTVELVKQIKELNEEGYKIILVVDDDYSITPLKETLRVEDIQNSLVASDSSGVPQRFQLTT
ncbi:Uncharacterised protein [uncultured archaeon]|nr:Uncharacterised protein [uncultured archaeon]